jgi:hypothetical protein
MFHYLIQKCSVEHLLTFSQTSCTRACCALAVCGVLRRCGSYCFSVVWQLLQGWQLCVFQWCYDEGLHRDGVYLLLLHNPTVAHNLTNAHVAQRHLQLPPRSFQPCRRVPVLHSFLLAEFSHALRCESIYTYVAVSSKKVS